MFRCLQLCFCGPKRKK